MYRAGHVSLECRQEDRVGDRREITSDGQGAPVTLGYSESGHQPPGSYGTWCSMSGRPDQSGASASPTETPQLRDTAADPHRNPTD